METGKNCNEIYLTRKQTKWEKKGLKEKRDRITTTRNTNAK